MKKKTLRSFFSVLQVALVLGAGFTVLQPLVPSAHAAGCPQPQPNVSDCSYENITDSNTIYGEGTANIATNWYYYGAPSQLILNHTYDIDATVVETQKRPGYSGDSYGIGIAKIISSQGLNLSNTNLTIDQIDTNRQNGEDVQHAVNGSAQDISGYSNSKWDSFQCAEAGTWPWNVGKVMSIDCKFTPTVTGYFQVDVNSFDYHEEQNDDCQIGYCGPAKGLYLQVVPPAPTPTPSPVPSTPTPTPVPSTPTPVPSTPTPTPVPSTSTPTPTPTPVVGTPECSAISLQDADTHQVYTNGSLLSPVTVNGVETNNQRNVLASIAGSGATNLPNNQLQVQWAMIEGTAGSLTWNESESSIETITPDSNGNFTATTASPFKVGPFDNNQGDNTGSIPAGQSYMFVIQPVLSYTNASNDRIIIPLGSDCNGGLTTTSAGQVLPANVSLSINKTLITSENPPIAVGQNIQFQVIVKNTSSEALTSVVFKDQWPNNGVVSFSSASATETNGSNTSGSVNLGLTASSGTALAVTNTVDLVQLLGTPLQPNDYFTVTLNFVAGNAAVNDNTNTDCAVANAIGKDDARIPDQTSCATVTITPPPVAPNTGADTTTTLEQWQHYLSLLEERSIF